MDLDAEEKELPKVMVNSATVNFNITNEAVFEDLIFEGNNYLAFYTESTNKDKPVTEFPFQFCLSSVVEDFHNGFEVTAVALTEASYVCKRP